MPLISVVLPVYNGEKTIKETIASVIKQTFTDFELIIINDGSVDSTLEIIPSFQDDRIKVFSYSNAGSSASRNRGISQACGEYISFIDADDLWTADKLETQLKALQENSQAALAYSWTDCIDESGKFLRQGGYISVNGNAYANLLLVNFIEHGSNPLIRAHVFSEAGIFDESLTSAEDWDMWLRIAARYHFVVVPKRQIFYRVSPNSMSASIHIKTEEKSVLQIIERSFAQADESIKHLKHVSLANFYKYFIFKVLDGYPSRQKGFLALRFLWTVVRNDPLMLKQPIIWTVLLKIAIVVLLQPQIAQKLPNKIQKLSDINNIFQFMQKTTN